MKGVRAMDEQPPKPKKSDTLSEQVRIRVDPELKSAIKEAAQLSERDEAEYTRRILRIAHGPVKLSCIDTPITLQPGQAVAITPTENGGWKLATSL